MHPMNKGKIHYLATILFEKINSITKGEEQGRERGVMVGHAAARMVKA